MILGVQNKKKIKSKLYFDIYFNIFASKYFIHTE